MDGHMFDNLGRDIVILAIIVFIVAFGLGALIF